VKLNCIIVDDEPVARNGLAEDIRAIGFMQVKGLAESAPQAMELLSRQPIDLVFLDIEMPKLNGFDLLRTLEQPPMVILTTAYNHYAPESYDLGVIDYLLKPVSFDRLLKACNKAKDYYTLQVNPVSRDIKDHFFIRINGKHEKIALSELLFVEAADNYILLHTIHKKHLIYRTLKSMEEHLPSSHFFKVHKSFIVAFEKVDRIEGNQLSIGNNTIPISRNLKKEIMERMVGKK
jgi:DNA-binding LytR/AlgR family response regulator